MADLNLNNIKGANLYVERKQCKHYDSHMETIKAYIDCLYSLKDCGAGGLLHILTDDNNITDSSVLYCLGECIKHPEREESKIGMLICEEYLKLSMNKRSRLVGFLNGWENPDCFGHDTCVDCPCMYL